MIRLLSFLIAIAFGLGIGEVGVNAVMDMARKSAHAHQHDQMPYSKWNKMLWEAKPVSPLRRPEKQ